MKASVPTISAPRGARFAIWPGSSLAKKPPRWVMAAELVETGRLWARVVAPVQPQWVEAAASHLLKWSYGEPEWDGARGAAVVAARATLYGLAVVPARRVDLARLDPEGAREMFIRHALVEGDWDAAPAFVAANRDLLDRLRALLQRARRHDLMVGEQALFDFYSARVGPEVTSGPGFNGWFRRAGPCWAGRSARRLMERVRGRSRRLPRCLGRLPRRMGSRRGWGATSSLRVGARCARRRRVRRSTPGTACEIGRRGPRMAGARPSRGTGPGTAASAPEGPPQGAGPGGTNTPGSSWPKPVPPTGRFFRCSPSR